MKYSDGAPEKTREECCPGYPYMSFSATPGVTLIASNPQKSSGLFRMSLKVTNGTTAVDIASRIAKEKHIKGNQ